MLAERCTIQQNMAWQAGHHFLVSREGGIVSGETKCIVGATYCLCVG